MINNDISADLSLQQDFNKIDKTITEIENLFSFDGGLNSLTNKIQSISSQELQNFIELNDNFVKKLTIVYNELLTTKTNQISGSARHSFQELENIMTTLQADIKMIANNNNNNNIILKDRNYLKNSLWIANILKGAYLEAKGVEFLNNSLNKYGYQILNTGDWKAQNATKGISGKIKTGKGYLNNFLDIVEDAVIINLQNGSVDKMFKNFQNTENVKLTLNDYQQLQNNIISGISMKSGSNNIRFKNNVTPKEALENAGYSSITAISLKRLMMLVDPEGFYHSKRILGRHAYYNSMFNYILGKSLIQLVGDTNKIMFDRNSILTTKDYLYKKFSAGYMMGIYNKNSYINIRNNKGETVGLVKR